jgi:hypothetical protein
MNTLFLYTTSGCHLCELAEELVREVKQSVPTHGRDFCLELIEISDDPALVTRYGVRIPVVRLNGQDTDLGWPFSYDELITYLLKAWPSVNSNPLIG